MAWDRESTAGPLKHAQSVELIEKIYCIHCLLYRSIVSMMVIAIPGHVHTVPANNCGM